MRSGNRPWRADAPRSRSQRSENDGGHLAGTRPAPKCRGKKRRNEWATQKQTAPWRRKHQQPSQQLIKKQQRQHKQQQQLHQRFQEHRLHAGCQPARPPESPRTRSTRRNRIAAPAPGDDLQTGRSGDKAQIYIYVYMYESICICAYICTYLYIYICICRHAFQGVVRPCSGQRTPLAQSEPDCAGGSRVLLGRCPGKSKIGLPMAAPGQYPPSTGTVRL